MDSGGIDRSESGGSSAPTADRVSLHVVPSNKLRTPTTKQTGIDGDDGLIPLGQPHDKYDRETVASRYGIQFPCDELTCSSGPPPRERGEEMKQQMRSEDSMAVDTTDCSEDERCKSTHSSHRQHNS